MRQESNVHFEFYLRNVTGGMRTPWKLLCVSVAECTGGGQVAWKLEYTMPIIVLGPLIVTEDVGHEALWSALVNEVCQPRAHALNCSVRNLA